jgi:hypothetical protein
MNRLLRIFKHRLLDETDTRRALDATAVERLRARVLDSERRHSRARSASAWRPGCR